MSGGPTRPRLSSAECGRAVRGSVEGFAVTHPALRTRGAVFFGEAAPGIGGLWGARTRVSWVVRGYSV